MHRNGFETISVWQETTNGVHAQSSPRAETDVCVIGAGIAGLTTAYLLQRAGRDVQVIDAHDVGAGESGRTTAHLTAVLDDRFCHLEKLFDVAGARAAATSHRAAIDLIEQIVATEGIDCDFERLDGILFCSRPEQLELLQQEAAAARRAGFEDLSDIDALKLTNLRCKGAALRFPGQATFHIGNYLRGLARAFASRGGHIATGVRAIRVEEDDLASVSLDDGRELRARHVVVATNTPFMDRVTMHTKQAAYRTYVVGFPVPRDYFGPCLLWDLEDPYHYVRIVRNVEGRDVLIVGGEDHKTGQDENPRKRFERLIEWARANFIGLEGISHRWSGQVMEPVDSLGFIGRNPGDKRIYIATGDSGNGMTHGTLAGIIINDLVAGRENPWQSLYDPARKTLQAAGSFIDENANVVGHLVKDWITRSDFRERNQIPIGSGAIVRDGLSLVAVYRDNDGRFHELSAACTHLGCVVQWNDVEKSWDCPCHGSRFAPDGSVLNGPAPTPLESKGNDEIEVPPTETATPHVQPQTP
jgi:glycine/D-amino acid oxidase-like deaminating enzyme/nitrite reductase/ring-hydroxylating ferredoxin subunit